MLSPELGDSQATTFLDNLFHCHRYQRRPCTGDGDRFLSLNNEASFFVCLTKETEAGDIKQLVQGCGDGVWPSG